MARASDNPFPSLLLVEGAAPTAPAGGRQRVFVDVADHQLKRVGSDGVVAALGGGGGLGARADATLTTAALVNGARETGTADITGRAGIAYRITTSRPARVRLYTTPAKRDADATRAATADPIGDHGLLLELITTATMLGVDLAPAVTLHNEESPRVARIAYTIDNLDTATGIVVVTVGRQVMEA